MASSEKKVPDAAVRAGVEAVAEEFEERGLGDPTLLVQVILDAAWPRLYQGRWQRYDEDVVEVVGGAAALPREEEADRGE